MFDLNDAAFAALWTTVGGIVLKVIESYLKRGEVKPTTELEKDKLEYEQASSMRAELRQEIKELRQLLTESDKARIELAAKVAQLEIANAKKDTEIIKLEVRVEQLQTELDRFNAKVYYTRKKEGE